MQYIELCFLKNLIAQSWISFFSLLLASHIYFVANPLKYKDISTGFDALCLRQSFSDTRCICIKLKA